MLTPSTPITSIPPQVLRERLAIPDTHSLAYTTTTLHINDELGREVCRGTTLGEIEAAWQSAHPE